MGMDLLTVSGALGTLPGTVQYKVRYHVIFWESSSGKKLHVGSGTVITFLIEDLRLYDECDSD